MSDNVNLALGLGAAGTFLGVGNLIYSVIIDKRVAAQAEIIKTLCEQMESLASGDKEKILREQREHIEKTLSDQNDEIAELRECVINMMETMKDKSQVVDGKFDNLVGQLSTHGVELKPLVVAPEPRKRDRKRKNKSSRSISKTEQRESQNNIINPISRKARR